MATMDMPVMPTPTVTMDTTARGLLMLRLHPLLRLMPMLTMVPTDMALPTTAMDTDMASPITVMPTMDTDMPTVMPIPMPTTDTTARGLLMLPPLLMLTMVLTAMVLPTTDTAMAMDM